MGFVGYKIHLITDSVADSISSFVVNFMIPCMLVSVIVNDGSKDGILAMIPVMGLNFLMEFLLLGIGFVSAVLLRLKGQTRNVHTCMVGYNNSGFYGYPILLAMYPEKSPAFIAVSILVDAFTLWTIAPVILHGQEARGEKNKVKIDWKKLINGSTIASVLAIVMVFTNFRPVHTVPWQAITAIGDACKYLAMIYIGADLGRKGIQLIKKCPKALWVIPVKLIIAPIIIYFLFRIFFFSILGEDYLMMLTLLASLPSMVAVVMIARNNHSDDEYAAGALLSNTVASMVTMPAVMWSVESFFA